jgi:hypothetical protein
MLARARQRLFLGVRILEVLKVKTDVPSGVYDTRNRIAVPKPEVEPNLPVAMMTT